MIDLSIIIVSYNTAELTHQCLKSLIDNLKQSNIQYEIIIVDNNSSDNSVSLLKKFQNSNVKLIINNKNLGYGKANNIGAKNASGNYLLLLNSDTIIENIYFRKIVDFVKSDPKIGGLTVKVKFPDGLIDPASHRGFPTIWRSFCYFSGLEKITKKTLLTRFFGGYHLTYLNLDTVHEIDSPSGAFFLIPKKIFSDIGGFDNQFFMYGEDLDLAIRIKQLGYKIIYYPYYSIIHFKHQSGLKADDKTRSETKQHFYNAMKIFYQKHYSQHHSWLINNLIYLIINFKSKFS